MKKYILFFVTFLFLIISSFFYSNKIFSFKFVDEEYDFVIGKYLTQGEILYDDLTTNHQPLTQILSSVIQRTTKPNSTYSLVNKHRQALIIWSFIWSIVIILYFGVGGLIFVVLYELTKIQLLGNLFLAEALIVYPVVTLLGLSLFLKRELRSVELFFWGICFSFSLFSLSPIWPLLLFLLCLMIKKQKKSLLKSLILLLLGFSLIYIFILQFISISGYFYYTFFLNLTYTIPSYHNESWVMTAFKAILTPFLSFFPFAATPTLWIIRILFVSLLYTLIRKRQFKKMLFFLIILSLINLRFIQPGTEGYNGFHLLPWYAVFIFICSMLVTSRQAINSILIFLAILTSLNFARGLFLKSNTKHDYYVNYSTQTDRGEIIKIMKGDNDTLFVSPDAWLIYWQSDTNHLPKLFGYYAWMAGVPSLHQKVLQSFEKKPPVFFYCDNCSGLDLTKYLIKYRELKRDNNATNLFILTEKIKQLTKKQRDELDYYKYGF